MSKKKGLVGGITLGVIIFIGLILVAMCSVKVPAGYVGVIYNMNGGIDGEVLTQGWHIVSPTKKVTNYSIGIEQSYLTTDNQGDSPSDDSFEVPSSDGKGLTVSLAFTYRFDQDKVTDTFTRFKGQSGADVKNSFIKPNIISWTKEITARYPVTDILGDKRSDLNIELTKYLKEKFEPFGIIIDNTSLVNIDPDKETRAAIQKKVNAQQEKELAQIEAETARIDANKKKEVALIEAEKDKETTKIKAEAKKIEAEAEAEANRKIANSLSKELIEKIKYEKWDGKLPTVDGSSTPIISIDK